jgi:hypothetical protein
LNPGSLILGSTALNYGGGTNWNGGNAAGLMMECDNNTEIVVHDNANRLASLMYYEGGATNKLTLGRNMGWDTLSSIVMNGNVSCTGSLGVSTNITCNAITCSSTGNALYVSGGGASIFSGKVGIVNAFPQAYLHLGNCEVVGSNPAIVFGKNTGGGTRNAYMGYTESFFFTIGDWGNSNAGSNTLTSQLAIIYSAPYASLVIGSNGYVTMQYGSGGASDERIKTNIKTIENALDKTLLLRGVEYNDFRIEPERKRIGLIAQEVELIVPEVVRTSEEDGMKSIEYQNLVGLLIEAIKDQQKQINELKNILKNNNLI